MCSSCVIQLQTSYTPARHTKTNANNFGHSNCQGQPILLRTLKNFPKNANKQDLNTYIQKLYACTRLLGSVCITAITNTSESGLFSAGLSPTGSERTE